MLYTLILVDDEIWTLRDMKLLLDGHADFRVIGDYTDPLEAEQAIREKMPDVVITDLKMENMDGVELMDAIDRYSPATKIIICSAYRNFDAARAALSRNVIDYLLKPIVPEEINGALARARALLDTQQQNASPEEAFEHCRVIAWHEAQQKKIRELEQEAPGPIRIIPLTGEKQMAYLYADDMERLEPWVASLCGQVGFSRCDGDAEEMKTEALAALYARFNFVPNKPMSSVQAFIALHYAQKLTLNTLAAQFHFSSAYLSELFHKKCGTSLTTFIKQVRIGMAARLLLTSRKTVREVALCVGYDDASHFCRVFKSITGVTTDEYRQQAEAAVSGTAE